jgi:hypothetical protein
VRAVSGLLNSNNGGGAQTFPMNNCRFEGAIKPELGQLDGLGPNGEGAKNPGECEGASGPSAALIGRTSESTACPGCGTARGTIGLVTGMVGGTAREFA